ncbi:uncharacterized protein LOC122722124 [Manihot esculenta]|uniref:uncharacterized protein LOC122722124 n=1 Tax=Manihot esculenta TaxID=3983 RepID=UPI001CC40DC4|nr:uncharacterized protein LOC122722124 [Manihot esculenta]
MVTFNSTASLAISSRMQTSPTFRKFSVANECHPSEIILLAGYLNNYAVHRLFSTCNIALSLHCVVLFATIFSGTYCASVMPLLSFPDNDILNAEDITHQSLASGVAEIVREQMFGGVAEASDLCLLALTGLLVSSARKRVAFQTRPGGQLGDTAREMLLMAMGVFLEIDAWDRALGDSVDRRIGEAHLEENLSATSDAWSNLAVPQEHSWSLQIELFTSREDDQPLPKGVLRIAAGPSEEGAELGEEDDGAVEAAGPQGGEEAGPPEGKLLPF